MPEPKAPKAPKSVAPTTPETYPTTPPQLPSGDYSYTVELVGTIQHELGKLTEAVNNLSHKSKDHGDKLDHACKDIHAAKVLLTVIGGAVALIATFASVAFKAYLDHAWAIAPK
jgi:hypothetical protein